MFTNISMAGTGVVITFISVVLNAAGVSFETESLADAVAGLVQFFGFVFIVWGQLRRKDLKAGIVRK